MTEKTTAAPMCTTPEQGAMCSETMVLDHGAVWICPRCRAVRLIRRDGGTAPYYLADGSTVTLPADEVERRRKAAAKVIAEARAILAEFDSMAALAIALASSASERLQLEARAKHAGMARLRSALDELGPEPEPRS